MTSSKRFHSMTSVVLCLLAGMHPAGAADCNGNGVDDALDIVPGNLRFLSVPNYPMEAGSLIAADLNGDGTPDLAGPTSGRAGEIVTTTGAISVLLNKGDGRFQDVVRYPLPVTPYQINSVIAADLDGDGKLDLVTTSTESVFVLINKGDGTFFEPATYSLQVDGLYDPHLLALDFNGDGKVDLAASDNRQIFVFLNRGDGTFLEPSQYSWGSRYSWSVVAADLNGDGKPDLASLTFNGDTQGYAVSVLLNAGDATFAGAVRYRVQGCSPSPSSPLIALDLDGDGRPDVALASEALGSSGTCEKGIVSALYNRGDGTFREPVSFDAGGLGDVDVLTAADLDGDGRPDLVGTATGGLSVLRNNGDGSFGASAIYPVVINTFQYAYQDAFVNAVDVNGDGALDLTLLDLKHGGPDYSDLLVLLNRGDGTFKDPQRYRIGTGPSLAIGDFNGDGRPDFASLEWNRVFMYFNKGDGTFEELAPHYPVGYDPHVVDLDGDGRPDLVAYGEDSHSNGFISVSLNRGDGTFGEVVRYASEIPLGVWLTDDLNNDGAPDVAVVGINGLSIFINRGDGTFQASVTYATQANFESLKLFAADFNGDGKVDLAASDNRQIFVFLNRGDGTFRDPVGSTVSDGWDSHLVSADLNGDGLPDFATFLADMDSSSVGINVFLNRGDGTFGQAGSYPVAFQDQFPLSPVSLIAADFDGDGKLDLATATNRDNNNGEIAILLNSGDGTFVDEPATYPTNYLTLLFAFDHNGDGRMDLASDNSILINDGDGTFTAQRWEVGWVTVVADLDGDGMLDLARPKGGCCFNPDWNPGGTIISLNRGDGTFGPPLVYPIESRALTASDLDGDGLPDLIVSATDGNTVFVLLNRTQPPFSVDLNHNGVPDECEVHFHRADPNNSGTTDISDAIAIFGFLFLGNPVTLSCKESADANNDGKIDISDGISILNWLFIGGPEPAAPGPPGVPCGLDPDPRGFLRDLGCETYTCK